MTAPRHTWLRKSAVLQKISCGTTMLYDLIREDGFPAPVKLGRASLWSEQEIDVWMSERLTKRDKMREAAE
jgi:prophage regulatory protein